MKIVVLEKKEVYSGDLLLVNTRYPLVDFKVKSLISVDAGFPDILIEEEAANALHLALGKICAGDNIVPVSGYRSMEEQSAIFDGSLAENGEAFTRKYVALPGCSEHQTGLAIDLALNQDDIDFIRPDFPYEGICDAFRKAAPDYGFIERYAKNKEQITGISHEPWHFRYVGYPHSKIISDSGLSLEEYISHMKAYTEDCRLIYKHPSETEVEIYYIPANDDKTAVPLPDDCVYQISGNNVDGFIVTVWRRHDDKT